MVKSKTEVVSESHCEGLGKFFTLIASTMLPSIPTAQKLVIQEMHFTLVRLNATVAVAFHIDVELF